MTASTGFHPPKDATHVYDVIVVGAGITGLTAAYFLYRQSIHNMLVLESTDRVGGMMHTAMAEGYQLETGPNSFPSSAESITSLCHQLGIEPQAARPAAKRKFIFYRGGLHPIPTDPGSFFRSPLLSPLSKLRLLLEPFQPALKRPSDESVADFTRRRLGKQVLHNLLGPYLAGIYAGNPETLSFSSIFPQLATWEKQFGSVFKGLLQQKKGPPSKPGVTPSSSMKKGLMNFGNGMGTLTEALAAALPKDRIQLKTGVEGFEQDQKNQTYRLLLSDGSVLLSKSVIFTSPAWVSAKLMRPVHPDIATLLGNIPYSPIAVVHLGFSHAEFKQTLDGFGFLVSQQNPLYIQGCLWMSSIYANRSPEGHILLTCYAGGATHPEVRDWSDDVILHQTLEDLKTAFRDPGLKPAFTRVIRHPMAIPQYTLGHSDRCEILQSYLKDVPGLFLAGNYLNGVSVNSCAQQGKAAAHEAIQYLSRLAVPLG